MSNRMIRKLDTLVTSKIGKTGRSALLIGTSLLGVLIVFDYKFSEIIESNGNVAGLEKFHHLWWTRLLFGRSRSRIWGYILNKKISVPFRIPLYSLFSYIYDCDLEELRYPLESYRCLGHFFARTLENTSRPIEDVSKDSIISPCDGQIISYGNITTNRIEQIKGSYYNVGAFLGIDSDEIIKKNLKYCIIYLAPGDYHHFHSPCEFKLKIRRHFSGELFPVSKSFIKMFNDVFSINERVILSGSWQNGNFHLGAVGAYNVGNIRLSKEPNFRSNLLRTQLWYLGGDIDLKTYNENKVRILPRGEHLGEFRMGSTIVIAFESPENFDWNVKIGSKIKVGQRIGGVGPLEEPQEQKYIYYFSESIDIN